MDVAETFQTLAIALGLGLLVGIQRERVDAPLAVLLLVAAVLAVVQWRRTRRGRVEVPEQHNPTELKPALIFGGLYALVVLAVAAARHYLGERGVYVAAAISGTTDMDAITLSTSRLRSAISCRRAWCGARSSSRSPPIPHSRERWCGCWAVARSGPGSGYSSPSRSPPRPSCSPCGPGDAGTRARRHRG
jgi:hypothetical protein